MIMKLLPNLSYLPLETSNTEKVASTRYFPLGGTTQAWVVNPHAKIDNNPFAITIQ